MSWEPVGNGNPPTQPSLIADLSKAANCYGIQRGKTASGYRKECAEIKNKKKRKKNELKILMVSVRVDRRP